MRLDRLEEIRGPPIVQEEDALSQAPQGRRPELVALGPALQDIVGQARSHGVHQDVRKQVDGLVPQRSHRAVARRQHRRVTERAADDHEELATLADR